MRLLLVVMALAVGTAWPMTATAAAAERPISGTLTGTITEGGGTCCFSYQTAEGTAVIRGIGNVSFTANQLAGCDPYEGLCTHNLDLTITTRSGDTLQLTASVHWQRGNPEPPLQWTVYQATGRFARYSGSGIFDVFPPDFTAGTLTLSLTGVLISA